MIDGHSCEEQTDFTARPLLYRREKQRLTFSETRERRAWTAVKSQELRTGSDFSNLFLFTELLLGQRASCVET